MEITNIRLTKNTRKKNPEFYADIELDRVFIVKGFQILRNKVDKTLWVALPSRRDKDNTKDEYGKVIYWPTSYFKKNKDKQLTEEAIEFKEKLSKQLVEAANRYNNGDYEPDPAY